MSEHDTRKMAIVMVDGRRFEFNVVLKSFGPDYGTRYGKPRTRAKIPRKLKKRGFRGLESMTASFEVCGVLDAPPS